MVEYVVCVCMQLCIVENSCIWLDKVTYVCILLQKYTSGSKIMNTDAYYYWNCLQKLRYDRKYFLVMHTAYCIELFCWLLYHLALNSCTQLHTGAYGYILLHIVSKCSVWLDMVEQGFVLLQVAAYVQTFTYCCKLMQISCNMAGYHCIWMCWIIWLHMVAYILKWMHDVNLILV